MAYQGAAAEARADGDMHHIISDGWSSGVMIREVSGPLRGIRQGGALSIERVGGAVRRLRGVAEEVG